MRFSSSVMSDIGLIATMSPSFTPFLISTNFSFETTQLDFGLHEPVVNLLGDVVLAVEFEHRQHRHRQHLVELVDQDRHLGASCPASGPAAA